MAVDSAQEALEPLSEREAGRGPRRPPTRTAVAERRFGPLRRWQLAPALEQLRWPFAVYASSRALYLLIAAVNPVAQHLSVKAELMNWDGLWYWRLAGLGYPHHGLHTQSVLGFLPLYPMLMWLVQHVLVCSIFVAGVLVSGVGGFIATVLIQRLSAGWWGEEASRRAVVLFCFFPGSIVFSMVYSEGVLIPLIAGCLLALERRRWLLAGVLAAFATAVGPTALAIIPACVAAAAIEMRRHGWRDPKAIKVLIAPALAPVGIAAYGAFLWIWTGSPLTTYYAQHHEWNEKTNPLALVTLVIRLVNESDVNHDHLLTVNLNYLAGLLGAIFLGVAVWLLFRARPRISVPALVWTLGIAFLAVTSENVPPNPRMLITSFPAVLVFAYWLKGRAFSLMIAISLVLLVSMTAVSYVGTALRP